MAERGASRSGLVIRGGEIVDGARLRRADVAIRNGMVEEVAETIEAPKGALVLDASGCVVGPGLVDLHTHLREPGGEAAETVETGAHAAALGGYTAVLAMPNTNPPIDCGAIVRDITALAIGACATVAVSGTITQGRAGERLSPMAEMAALGVRIFTDDGAGVQDAGLMRRALEYASDLGVVLAQHCEDATLARGGHMHEGEWSARLGIPGQPALAEEAMLARDLALVALTGAPMHFLHLSTAGSVELIRRAKKDGLPVTAEVTPHHLSLTDAEVATFDPVFKVNPPLRSDRDVAALRAAVVAGVFDAIATDHAPHVAETKEEPFEGAPPGMLGLETAFSVCAGALCANAGAIGRTLTMAGLFRLFSTQPAVIAGLDESDGQGGAIAVGAHAHLCIFDPEARWVVDPRAGASRSHNSPYAGRTLTGRVRHTIYRGEPVVIDGVAQR